MSSENEYINPIFIGTVKTRLNETYTLETQDFSEAWQFLWNTSDQLGKDVIYAAVLKDVGLHPNREMAVMRTIR